MFSIQSFSNLKFENSRARATNKYAVNNLKRERKTLALDHIRQISLIHASPFTSYNNINIYFLCSKVFQLFRSYGILLYVLELCTFVNYARALLVYLLKGSEPFWGHFVLYMVPVMVYWHKMHCIITFL